MSNKSASGPEMPRDEKIAIMAQSLISEYGSPAAIEIAQCQAALAIGDIRATWMNIIGYISNFVVPPR